MLKEKVLPGPFEDRLDLIILFWMSWFRCVWRSQKESQVFPGGRVGRKEMSEELENERVLQLGALTVKDDCVMCRRALGPLLH